MTPNGARQFSYRRIAKEYPTSRGIVRALDDITFSVREQEFVCIVGPSGCGKTTLLKIIAGLSKPTTGEIILSPTRANGNPRCAMVFQEHGLFPWMTVLENVTFGLEMQGVDRRVRESRAYALIDETGLTLFASNYPHELSVGMCQRVGIARAFVSDAEILLMDEPFGSLDAQTKLVLQQQLLRIWKEHRKSIIYVTHDIDEAILLGDRVLVMSGRPGRIREEINIPLERPRNLIETTNPRVTEIKWHIWKMLEKEAQQNLSVPR